MTLQTKTTTDFFNSEYCNFGSYDNLRKIASIMDGQKNAARKVLWFIQQKNQTQEIKVSQLDSKVAEYTEYLHGSMSGVIVNLAQNRPGTNNLNLLHPEGNFGTRLIPEASAPRYIYTFGTPDFFEIFNKEDNEILQGQTFEGHQIEPTFLLPKLPLLLINGSEGISSGFAQKILPRNPDEIKKYLTYYLKKPNNPRKPFKGTPWFRGFKGTVKGLEKNQWVIQGVFNRKGNKVIITELPIGYNLKSYLKVLDKLEDDKKIVSYTENCIDDFHFEVQFNKKYLDTLPDEKLIDLLKLQKKVTENFTVMDHQNKVQVYDSVDDLFHGYYKVKMVYLQKRKNHLIKIITNDIKEKVSKYTFIKNIIDETLVITKRPTDDILLDLKSLHNVIAIDNSYDYLLKMPIHSLTEERMNKLLQQIKDSKRYLDEIKTTSLENLWLKDLN